MERTTVGSLLRSTQAYCLQLCEKHTLDYGIAYVSDRFRDLPEACQFREVLIQDPGRIPDAFAETEDWFTQRKFFCGRWAPAGGAAGEPLAAFLGDRGFRRRAYAALALTSWGELPAASDARVLPARAMRAALGETYTAGETPAAPAARRLLAEAANERLDDPQLDVFLAMVDRQPAGRCALHQVGDIARVMDLTVLPGFTGRNVEWALLSHVLALARRLAMRTVLAQVEADDGQGLGWLQRAGFIIDGEIAEFDRDPVDTARG